MSYWGAIEAAFDEVNIYDGEVPYREGCARYPAWVVELLATHCFLSEVSNGGLAQFFHNSTGVVGPEAVLGLVRVGRGDAAADLQDALNLFGVPFPRAAEARAAALNRIRPELPPIEERLYSVLGPDLGEGWNAMDTYAESLNGRDDR